MTNKTKATLLRNTATQVLAGFMVGKNTNIPSQERRRLVETSYDFAYEILAHHNIVVAQLEKLDLDTQGPNTNLQD